MRDAQSTARDTSPARRAFLARFEREVDPDGALPPDERARLAAAARSLHFTRLSLLAARARREKAGAA